MLVKNTYGLSVILSSKSIKNRSSLILFAGSSLDRKKAKPKNLINEINEEINLEQEQQEAESKKKRKRAGELRSMSPRTKQKIRKKVTAFSQVYEKLNFLTLTFVNQVEDKQAVAILGKFLDNCTKQLKDFQYIWVAERQTKNETFQDNIHFHLITNKYFKIDKYWNYWNKLQEKNGIIPRNEDFKASSSFDIRRLNSKNIKAISQYITKYIIKNRDEFDCQVWNCSKGISNFYTDFYSNYEFIRNLEKVLETELEPIPAEYCTVYSVPLNRRTLPMYERLNEKNRQAVKIHLQNNSSTK